MNIKPIPIPEEDSRLSNMTRFFETVYKDKRSILKENTAWYFIANDTSNKTFTLPSTGIYQRDATQEKWGFIYSAWEVTIPKDWWYYIGYMINIYQIHVPSVVFTCKGITSSSEFPNERDNYWYATLWSSWMYQLTKDEKISITYNISAWSSYSPNGVNTIYNATKLMIFEMPTLSIN